MGKAGNKKKLNPEDPEVGRLSKMEPEELGAMMQGLDIHNPEDYAKLLDIQEAAVVATLRKSNMRNTFENRHKIRKMARMQEQMARIMMATDKDAAMAMFEGQLGPPS